MGVVVGGWRPERGRKSRGDDGRIVRLGQIISSSSPRVRPLTALGPPLALAVRERAVSESNRIHNPTRANTDRCEPITTTCEIIPFYFHPYIPNPISRPSGRRLIEIRPPTYDCTADQACHDLATENIWLINARCLHLSFCRYAVRALEPRAALFLHASLSH